MADDNTLSSTPDTPVRRVRPQHRLVMVYPERRVVAVPDGRTIVGREPPNGGIAFSDMTMSRSHAELNVSGQRAELRDLDSHNGVWVDGVRTKSMTLQPGAVIRLGAALFVYRMDLDAHAPAPVPELEGSSPGMVHLRELLCRVAPSNAPIVLLGETGTGKTAAARAVHRLSRRKGALIHVNCSAIPENLAESELFGHKAGAFTDARVDKPGLIRAADKGTLLLDEIGMLSPASQARLLLVLESGQVTPVGTTTPVAVDVRIIAATNENLPKQVRAGVFRPDLYARLNMVTLYLPPLRERREDILPLFQQSWGGRPPQLTPDAATRLLLWRWPFNVREVQQTAGDLRLRLGDDAKIDRGALEDRFVEDESEAAPAAEPVGVDRDAPPSDTELRTMLAEAKGVVAEVARRVDRSTKQVYRWCARYGIDPADFR